jgi:hypothetical protein
VSRTVVREAVAALRAEGLVITRQGVGAFVSAEPQHAPFRIEPERMQTLADDPDVMELRSAWRSSPPASPPSAPRKAQLRASRSAECDGRGQRRRPLGGRRGPRVPSRHRRATGNPEFPRFLQFIGRHLIPRRTVSGLPERMGGQRAYLALIQEEHRASSTRSATAIPGARARRCAATSRARSSATASSPPSAKQAA